MDIDLAELDYIAVAVGVVINMAAGAFWYSPVLFAKAWMSEVGLTAERIQADRAGAYRGYAVSIVASIVIAFTLAIIVEAAGADTALDGLVLGLLAGVGFVAATQASNYTFESKSLKLYLINIGYPVVVFVVLGILLSVWR